MAAVQAAETKATPSIIIEWYGLLDHEGLVEWPPTQRTSKRQKIITDKLRALIAERDVRVHVVAPMTTDDNLQLGRKAVAAGERAYNALEHAQTLSELNRALKFFESSNHHLTHPLEVSHAYRLLAQTQLELNNEGEALEYFRKALELDPEMTINDETEHPDTIELFLTARRSFLRRPPEQQRFLMQQLDDRNTIKIAGRLFQNRLELFILSPTGQRFESESIHTQTDENLSRIASRLLDCAPRQPVILNPQKVRKKYWFTGGIGLGAYTESPIEMFPTFAAEFSFLQHLSTFGQFISGTRISYDGIDPSAHLRTNSSHIQLFAGPRPFVTMGRAMVSAHILPWIGRRGDIVMTTNPACKFFRPTDTPPNELCNFARDVQTIPAAWEGGVEIAIGTQFRIYRTLRLYLENTLQMKLMEQEPSPFNRRLMVSGGLVIAL